MLQQYTRKTYDIIISPLLTRGVVANSYISCSPPSSKRSSISTFSKRSRRRLRDLLLSFQTPPRIMITLTYPKFYPADSSEWKRHLDRFRKALTRRFPDSWFVWKLEPQRRGAPHYHLVGDLKADVDIVFFRHWVSKIWFRCVGSPYLEHYKAGTRVDVLDSNKKVISYIFKYVAKTQDLPPEWAHPGRFWGVINRQNLPSRSIKNIRVDKTTYALIKRTLRRWKKSKLRKKINYLKNDCFSIIEHECFVITLIQRIAPWALLDFDVGQ